MADASRESERHARERDDAWKALSEAPSGTVVLFSGAAVVSRLIELVTLSPWSHVGLVLRLADGRAMLLESTREDDELLDELSMRHLGDGVRLVAVSEYARKHPFKRFALRYRCPRLAGTRELVLRCAREFASVPYERRMSQLLKSGYDGPGGLSERDLSSIFCSELVAEILIREGLLPWREPSSEYTPADFAPGGKVDALRAAHAGCCMSDLGARRDAHERSAVRKNKKHK